MKTAKKLIFLILAITMLSALFTIGVAATNEDLVFGGATVNTEALNLRSGPGLTYSIITTIPRGAVVVVYERANSEWLRVNFHGTVGYATCQFLETILPARNFAALGRVEGHLVNIRSGPSTTSTVLSVVAENTDIDVIGVNNGWFKVLHGSHVGYVRSDIMRVIGAPRPGVLPAHSNAATTASPVSAVVPIAPVVSAAPVAPRPAPDPNLPLAEQVVEFARGYLGTRYVWGGSSPAGFDCSGFVSYIMRNFDISLRRVANDQFHNNGTRISRDELVPGDLVFFSSNNGRSITHVGIYIGDNYFIHSSSARNGVVISSLNTAWHRSTWAGANRIIT
jgi:uncharacterized protein YraI